MRPRAVGFVVLTMSVVVLGVAIALADWYHLGVAGQLGAFALSLPGLVLAWIAYQAGYVVPTLAEAADQLADAIQAQWKTELRVRWLDGPVQMPVSWLQVSADPTDDFANHGKSVLGQRKMDWPLISVGSGGHRPRIDWHSRLARSRNNLDELHRKSANRLIVLGAPGSGKTVLLMRLVIQLIECRGVGDPVPVLVPLASWDPRSQDLRSWLVARLTVDHPGLKNPAPGQLGSLNLASAMLEKHLIVLLLDGLDEISPEARRMALEQIYGYLHPGDRLFLSSRTEEFFDAKGSEGAPRLPDVTAIMLRPLTPNTVAGYLRGLAADGLASRWECVLKALKTNAVLAEVLSTPLMVELARIAYNTENRVDDTSFPDPAELSDNERFASAADLRAHLFNAFIDAAYRARARSVHGRWDLADVKRWLAFLAHHLESGMAGTSDLGWWTLRLSAPKWLVPLVTGVACGTAAGLAAGLGRHSGLGIGVGLGVGTLAGLAVGLTIRRITGFSQRNQGPLGGIAGGLVGAVIGAVAAGFAGKIGLGSALGPFGGLDVALGIGVGVGSSTSFVGGLAGGLFGGFVGAFARGVAEGILAGLVNGLGAGLATALAVALVARKLPASNLRWSPVGVLGGLVIGLAVSFITTSVEGPVAGVLLGLSIGILSAWPCGLTGRKVDLSKASSPRDVFGHDRRAFIKTSFAAGLPAGIAGFVGGGLTSVFEVKAHANLSVLIGDGLGIGLASALIIGLAFGFYHAAYGSFFIEHLWLALLGKLPWRLMLFLTDAHEKGVLRESGAFYQFRHMDLQRQVARAYPVAPKRRHRRGADITELDRRV
jgi:hypothetical protein